MDSQNMDSFNVTSGSQYSRQTFSVSNNASQFNPPTQSQSRGTGGRSRASGGQNVVGKAKWDDANTEVFIKLCLTETRNVNRPGTHFSKIGWQNLVARFNQASGLSYSRKMLKNKWDVLKKDWGIWNKLVRNETGLGWDPVAQTVVASPEWWTTKLQVTPDAAKFRSRGPLLVDDQQVLFNDCVATGAEAWAPTDGIMMPHMMGEEDHEPGTLAAIDEVDEVDEVAIDSETTTIGGAVSGDEPIDDVQTQPTPTPTPARRTRSLPPRSRISKGTTYKKPTTAQIVAKCLQTMANKFETKKCACQSDKGDNSIESCLAILDGLEDIELGGDVWMYATRVFLKPNVRELFSKMKNDRVRSMWLQAQAARDEPKAYNASTSFTSPGSSNGPSCNYPNY